MSQLLRLGFIENPPMSTKNERYHEEEEEQYFTMRSNEMNVASMHESEGNNLSV
jgi:hypothetical protein